MMLQTNQPAPDFDVPDQDKHMVKLSDFRDNKNVVLYFYPKDDTPGCTIEGKDFSALIDEFTALDTVVLGVSKDGCASHRDFMDKYGLRVTLLADTWGHVCESYGVWQEKEKNGEKVMGIVRSTFIIDKNGMIAEAMYGVTADGHAQAVLDRLRQL